MSLVYRNDILRWKEFYSEMLSLISLEDDYDKEEIEASLLLLRNKFFELIANDNFDGMDYIEIIAYTYVFTLALSGEIRQKNQDFKEMMGTLSADVSANQILLIASKLFLPDELNLGYLFKENSILNKYLLISKPLAREALLLDREYSLRPEIAACLLGLPYDMGDTRGAIRVYEEDSPGEIIDAYELYDELAMVYAYLAHSKENSVILLRGEEGVGKTFMLRYLAAIKGKKLLVIKEELLSAMDFMEASELINKAIAKALFDDAILYISFNKSEHSNTNKQKAMLAQISMELPLVIASGSEAFLDDCLNLMPVHIIRFKAPDKNTQKRFFEYFAEENDIIFAPDLDLSEIVSLYNLTPDKIKKALNCAKARAELCEDGYLINSSILKNEIRKLCTVGFDKLAVKLESNFKWEDIELSDTSKNMLIEAMNRIRYKSIVNDTYGFDKSLPYGRGLTIALYGPPGTGKTMAANVIANELGMDIYRIDLSQISSKYIGESEKNLGAVFEAARYSNAILFFDEADALFSKRTDVASSNDKHANTETAYLLQKMEEYPGVCILATNVISNFDAAFKRRITYMIPIEKLSEDMRYELWKKVFANNTPLANDVSLKHYAKMADLSGSGIKAAALSAAYKAAARGDMVTHMDLCEAIDEEYKKSGHTSILPSLISRSSY